ncbi:MAG: toxin-antitoxin system YwqK family antitoxin [Bacteroidota bacterium]|nr:toxin-antitoxin system YwqK family antitoxin [Bacteroidota bacterium]
MKKLTFLLTALIISVTVFSQEKKVAISPVFDREKEVSNMYKLMVRMSLTKAIANQPNYDALERKNVDKIVDEVHFQETGMVTDAEIIELGNMLGADYVCNLEVASDNNQIVISASIIEIETGKAVPGKNDFIVSDLDNYKIETACKELVAKLFFSNKIYLDANWQPLPNKTSAKYYRIVDFINETNRAKVRDYYMDGQIQMTGEGIFNDKSNLADYIMDGEFTFYDEKGNTTEISNYKNDKLHGKYFEYYENGKGKFIANYKNDLLNGDCILFYSDGKPKEKIHYINNRVNNSYQRFYPSGKLEYNCNMLNGKISGKFEQYYRSGNIKYSAQVINSEFNGSFTEFYDNGITKAEGNNVNGYFSGYTTLYYDTGKPQFKGNMKKGKAHGSCNIYYKNGNKLNLEFEDGIAYRNDYPIKIITDKMYIVLDFGME